MTSIQPIDQPSSPVAPDLTVITLDRVACVRLDGILGSSRVKGRVEYQVMSELREKIFPEALKTSAQLPGQPNAFSTQVILSLPPNVVHVTGPEREILRRALTDYEMSEVGPGVSAEDGKWFYPLLDQIESKG